MSSINKNAKIINRDNVWKMFGKRCAYCGCLLESSSGKYMHIDHVKPLGRLQLNKGIFKHPENDYKNNTVPSCPFCNRYKTDLDLETFRQWLKDTPTKLSNVTLYRNALRFGMIELKQWDGIFWFEKYHK